MNSRPPHPPKTATTKTMYLFFIATSLMHHGDAKEEQVFLAEYFIFL